MKRIKYIMSVCLSKNSTKSFPSSGKIKNMEGDKGEVDEFRKRKTVQKKRRQILDIST